MWALCTEKIIRDRKLDAYQARFGFFRERTGPALARFDVFSRVIIGAKLAMGVVILSTVLAMLIGVPLGLLALVTALAMNYLYTDRFFEVD